MKWMKHQTLADILAKIIAILILQSYKNEDFDDIADLFYMSVPYLRKSKIIRFYKNVVGAKIHNWPKITRTQYLQIWIYENEQKIIEHLKHEFLKKISQPIGCKNLFHIKCIYPNSSTVERCLP